MLKCIKCHAELYFDGISGTLCPKCWAKVYGEIPPATRVFLTNNNLIEIEKRLKAEIEAIFDKVKNVSTLEEIASLRGQMDGISYALQVVEHVKGGG